MEDFLISQEKIDLFLEMTYLEFQGQIDLTGDFRAKLIAAFRKSTGKSQTYTQGLFDAVFPTLLKKHIHPLAKLGYSYANCDLKAMKLICEVPYKASLKYMKDSVKVKPDQIYTGPSPIKQQSLPFQTGYAVGQEFPNGSAYVQKHETLNLNPNLTLDTQKAFDRSYFQRSSAMWRANKIAVEGPTGLRDAGFTYLDKEDRGERKRKVQKDRH